MVSFPFRFIDEVSVGRGSHGQINQNMDKRNERYVMTQLLYKGRNRNAVAPQTFIITPKLLSDFPLGVEAMIERRFDENVTFHIIFQGQYLPQGFNWSVVASGFAASKRAIEDEDEERKRQRTSSSKWCVCWKKGVVFESQLCYSQTPKTCNTYIKEDDLKLNHQRR